MGLSSFKLLRHGELLAENCEFFLPHSHLTPSLGVNPFEFLDSFLSQKQVLGLSIGEEFCDPSLRPFYSVTACDGRTDRRTDIPTMASTRLA